MEAAISEIVERLREMSISKIIIFGSTGTGSVHADSDIDMAVVVSDPQEFDSYDARLEAKSEIRARLRDVNRCLPIDILLYTEREFAQSLAEPGFVADEIVRHGRTVYEKAS